MEDTTPAVSINTVEELLAMLRNLSGQVYAKIPVGHNGNAQRIWVAVKVNDLTDALTLCNMEDSVQAWVSQVGDIFIIS